MATYKSRTIPSRTKTAKNKRPTKKTAKRMTPKEKAVRNEERPALRPSAGGGISGGTANAVVFHSGPSEPFTSTTHAVRLMVSRLRGRAVQTSAPMTRESRGVLFCNRILCQRGQRRLLRLSTGLAMELILRRRIDIASFANPSAVWVKPTLDPGNDPLLAW